MRRSFLIIFLSLVFVAHAVADKRAALVIGNSAYKNATTLVNPRNDATDIAAALTAVGFTVIVGLDLSKIEMDHKVLEFAASLAGADAGVFFYSGHGMQVSGVNYLVPVDAELKTPAALDFEMLRLDLVQRTMEREAKTNILFLDACRNNPLARNLARAFGTRSVEIGHGLAPAESGIGTLISFSTQPGNAALDGIGRNSPYSGPLAKAIANSNDDILSILTEVRNEVLAATNEKQVPWENHALRARFYFTPPMPAAAPTAAALSSISAGGTTSEVGPMALATPPPTPLRAPMSEVARTWADIKDMKDVAIFELFRRQYGAGSPLYDTLAELRIAELNKTRVAAAAPQRLQVPQTREDPRCDGLLVSAALTKPCIKPGSGQSFKDCPDCPEMVIAPAGTFLMGAPADEPETSAEERPQHKVTIRHPFAIGKFALRFSEWDACVAGGGCGGYRPRDAGWGRKDRPVININWNDAKGYVKWLSAKTGQTYRLLSEAEYEFAARAGTQSPFWWGTGISPEQANYNGSTVFVGGGIAGEYRRKTLPVQSFDPNPWGLYQIHGNVWSWTEDCWSDTYKEAPVDEVAKLTGDCSRRVLRGGSWFDDPGDLRAAKHVAYSIDLRTTGIGLRVARTLP